MNPWILIADASDARIFELDEARNLKLIEHLPNPQGRALAQDLKSDEPGRLEKGGGRHVLSAMDPRTTPHAAEMHRFAHQLAERLQEATDQNKLRTLALVAPPHFLGALRRELDPVVAQCVSASLDKDYTHLAEHQLRTQLVPIFEEIEKALRVSRL